MTCTRDGHIIFLSLLFLHPHDLKMNCISISLLGQGPYINCAQYEQKSYKMFKFITGYQLPLAVGGVCPSPPPPPPTRLRCNDLISFFLLQCAFIYWRAYSDQRESVFRSDANVLARSEDLKILPPPQKKKKKKKKKILDQPLQLSTIKLSHFNSLLLIIWSSRNKCCCCFYMTCFNIQCACMAEFYTPPCCQWRSLDFSTGGGGGGQSVEGTEGREIFEHSCIKMAIFPH